VSEQNRLNVSGTVSLKGGTQVRGRCKCGQPIKFANTDRCEDCLVGIQRKVWDNGAELKGILRPRKLSDL
jgi:hypothetical protein